MPIDVGPNRSMLGKFGGYNQPSVGMRPPNTINRPPGPMPNPMGNPRGIPFTGNQGFLPPGGPPPMPGPIQTGGMEPPIATPPPNMSIDVAPSGYTDPNNANIPDIVQGAMGQSSGANRIGGGLRNAYAGAGPNLSAQPFRNKLFY